VGGKCINAEVGGVVLNLLVDSGASCNIIDEDTWKQCKSQNIKCKSKKAVEKNIYTYGQEKALKLLGEFQCNIEIGNQKTRATFLVLKGKGKALLGYETATRLGILRIGPEISNINVFEKEQDPIFRGTGKLKDFQLTLPINKAHPPIAQPVRRIPFKLREKVEKQIETLIDNDIIERVEGPTAWVSPAVPIIKKSGEIRLCVDMRRVNEAIMRERYPLPVLEDILDTVRGNNWFSTVDIKSAYHQIELDEESRKTRLPHL